MAITTYTELQTAIGNWLNRSDLASKIPDFITLAETEFNLELRVRQMVKRAEATLNEEYEDLPSDYLELVELKLDTDPIVKPDFMTIGQLSTTYPSASVGEPAGYTIVGDELQFRPIPDTSYTLKIAYYAKVTALSVSNPTNWLLDLYPGLYLYASLLEAAPYVRDKEAIAIWEMKYASILQRITKADKRANYNAAPLAVKAG